GQERGTPGRAQPLDDPADGDLLAEGNDELVLQEAVASVDAIPVADTVQGVEERVQGVEAAQLAPGRLPEPQLVERGDRRSPEQPRRHPRRRRQTGAGIEREGRPAVAGGPPPAGGVV